MPPIASLGTASSTTIWTMQGSWFANRVSCALQEVADLDHFTGTCAGPTACPLQSKKPAAAPLHRHRSHSGCTATSTAAIARKQQHQYLHQHQHQHQHWQILTILESRARVRLEGRDGWHLPLARTRRSCGGMVSRWAKLGVRGNQSGDHWGQAVASAWKRDDAYYG